MRARCVNRRGRTESPEPPTTPVSPVARMDAMFTAVAPAVADDFTWAFHWTVRVAAGGRSTFQVRTVVPGPDCLEPGLDGAHPVGVMVHPMHGSLKPQPAHQASIWAGTVS